jgi:excisionase family DNA binding protein
MQTRSGVEVYRQADAARRLKVSRTTITRMIRSGELATVDQDGFRLVTSESLRVAQAKRNKLLKLGIG